VTRARAIVLWCAVCVLAACATTPVQPWQKRQLAQRAMRFDGGNALEADFATQVATSREAARGGDGVGGGGCGCN